MDLVIRPKSALALALLALLTSTIPVPLAEDLVSEYRKLLSDSYQLDLAISPRPAPETLSAALRILSRADPSADLQVDSICDL